MSTPESAETTHDSESMAQEFHCPVCSFGPGEADDVLLHIITNHSVEN